MDFKTAQMNAFLIEEAEKARENFADEAYEAVTDIKNKCGAISTFVDSLRQSTARDADLLMYAWFGELARSSAAKHFEPRLWEVFCKGDENKTEQIVNSLNKTIDEYVEILSELEELRGKLTRAVIGIKDANKYLAKENAND